MRKLERGKSGRKRKREREERVREIKDEREREREGGRDRRLIKKHNVVI